MLETKNLFEEDKLFNFMSSFQAWVSSNRVKMTRFKRFLCSNGCYILLGGIQDVSLFHNFIMERNG